MHGVHGVAGSNPVAPTIYIYYFFIELINFTIFNPSATDGPIPTANDIVAMPTVTPKINPMNTTDVSINILITEIGYLEFFCNPVINPARGPEPKLAIK